MTKLGYTAGTWEFHCGYMIRACNGDICTPVADLRTPYRYGVGLIKGEREHHANGNLIASAPELLDALELLKNAILKNTNGMPDWLSKAMDAADAAIAKATGA